MSTEETVRIDTAAAQDKDYPDERPYPGYVRVNLLPDSILDRLKVLRAKRRAVLFVVVAIALVAGLWLLAQREISSAQARVDEAQATNVALQAQVNELSQVPAVFATAEQAQTALSEAMGSEIRWSFLLNQLSFATPPGVTLDSISGSMTEGAAATSPGGVLPMQPAVGTMTFNGTGSNFSSVAGWLDSLQALKDYTYPFLTNSARDGGQGRVTWESTANLSTNALSGTYGTPAASSGTTAAPGTTPTPAPTTQPPSDGAQ